MRTKTIELYTFDELAPEIQERVISDWRNNMDWEDYEHELDEGFESIERFCESFGVSVSECHISAFQPCYLRSDATPEHFRNIKLKSIDREAMPTGYYIDSYLWETFYDEFKCSSNAYHAFQYAIESAIAAIKQACEYYYEDESIISRIQANEYEFLEDGTLS